MAIANPDGHDVTDTSGRSLIASRHTANTASRTYRKRFITAVSV